MKNKLRLLTAFFVLSFVMTMGGIVFNIDGAGVLKAEAAEGNTGDFVVETTSYYATATDPGFSYSESDRVLTISGGGEYKISMDANATPTSDTIKVTADDEVTITLKNVNITSSTASPIEIAENAGAVTIELDGTNSLVATGNGNLGIQISTSSQVTITSADGDGSELGELNVTSLSAYDYNFSSAIGSYNSGYAIDITIKGGTIAASTLADHDNYGAAIGSYKDNAKITIDGGKITATAKAYGNNHGAAIGSYMSNVNITINDGEITAEVDAPIAATEESSDEESDTTKVGYNYGTAIGTDNGSADITINGGTIKATAFGEVYNYGSAIGSHVTADDGSTKIDITEGTITAEAASSYINCGAAIGSYSGGADINISGGTINATATATADTSDGTNNIVNYGAAIGSDFDDVNINITGGTINATTSALGINRGAAIGSRSGAVNIIIGDGEITATATAEGDSNSGAAIGSDEGTVNITITGGTIEASTSNDGISYGAAIGSSSNTADITIKGGEVTAKTEGSAYGTNAMAIEPNNGSVYISPTVNTLIKVEYEKNATPTEYYYETRINDEVGGDYFHSYLGDVTYGDANVSIEYDSTNNVYNVIVSEYGGKDPARYLESVIVLVNDMDKNVVEGQELEYYEEYFDGTEDLEDSEDSVANSIVFKVDASSLTGEHKVICALVKTYYNRDANNTKGDIQYFLSGNLLAESEG